MKLTLLSSFMLGLALTSCLTRAPGSPELDIRSGLKPNSISKSPLSDARFSSQMEKSPMQPVRIAPLIEKIWVYDQHLGANAWLQGTWLYVEVEPAQWFDAVDPGAAPMVFTLSKEQQPQPPIQTKTIKKKKK